MTCRDKKSTIGHSVASGHFGVLGKSGQVAVRPSWKWHALRSWRSLVASPQIPNCQLQGNRMKKIRRAGFVTTFNLLNLSFLKKHLNKKEMIQKNNRKCHPTAKFQHWVLHGPSLGANHPWLAKFSTQPLTALLHLEGKGPQLLNFCGGILTVLTISKAIRL